MYKSRKTRVERERGGTERIEKNEMKVVTEVRGP